MQNLMPRQAGDCVERRRKAHFDFLIAAYRFFPASDGKQHKTRTVEISSATGAINERRKHTESEYLFANRNGKPNQHLLRDLQSSRHESLSEIPPRIAEAVQDWSSRRYHAGVPLPTVTQELGHESLAATED